MNEAIELAKTMNTLTNVEKINVPVLDDFELEDVTLTDPDHRTIFIAKKNNTIEQFFGDGALDEEETFEEHLEKTINQMKESVEGLSLYEGNDKYLFFYKDHYGQQFDFKVYIQDILSGTKEDLKFVRQLSGFFLEPNDNEFYQISVAAGMYSAKEHKLLKDIETYEDDEIITTLEKNLRLIMDNITYK